MVGVGLGAYLSWEGAVSASPGSAHLYPWSPIAIAYVAIAVVGVVVWFVGGKSRKDEPRAPVASVNHYHLYFPASGDALPRSNSAPVQAEPSEAEPTGEYET